MIIQCKQGFYRAFCIWIDRYLGIQVQNLKIDLTLVVLRLCQRWVPLSVKSIFGFGYLILRYLYIFVVSSKSISSKFWFWNLGGNLWHQKPGHRTHLHVEHPVHILVVQLNFLDKRLVLSKNTSLHMLVHNDIIL